MPTFITGGTSSIGRVLIKELAHAGEAMRVLVRQRSNKTGLELEGVEFFTGDVTDAQAVRQGMRGCERVVHMAAVVGQNVTRDEWWRVNRDGTQNVLQAAAGTGVHSMVQVSSLSVLGPTAPDETADENREVDPAVYTTLYQITKRAADDLAREFSQWGLPVCIVYPGFGYGCSFASSHPSMAEMTLLRLAAGKPIAQFGDGHNRICMAYYKDTVRGIRQALERGRSGEGYILGGENLTFPEIWLILAEVLGKESPRRHIPFWVLEMLARTSRQLLGRTLIPPELFDMIRSSWNFSTEKARRELEWSPTAFKAGMQETWQEYQAQGWHP